MVLDKVMASYVEQKGWKVSPAGLIQLTKAQAAAEPYMGRSIYNPKQRTLMVAGAHGSTLLFEGQHFEIV